MTVITTSTQQVTITATGASDPLVVNPVVAAANDTATTDAGNTVASGNAITDVFDSSGDSSVTLSLTDVNGQGTDTTVAGTYGSLFVGSDGFYAYTANAAFDQLQVGNNPTDQFNITVMDSLGRSQTTTLTFNIIGADDAAVITSTNALGSDHGRCGADGRGQWRLRNRRSHRLFLFRRDGRSAVSRRRVRQLFGAALPAAVAASGRTSRPPRDSTIS